MGRIARYGPFNVHVVERQMKRSIGCLTPEGVRYCGVLTYAVFSWPDARKATGGGLALSLLSRRPQKLPLAVTTSCWWVGVGTNSRPSSIQTTFWTLFGVGPQRVEDVVRADREAGVVAHEHTYGAKAAQSVARDDRCRDDVSLEWPGSSRSNPGQA